MRAEFLHETARASSKHDILGEFRRSANQTASSPPVRQPLSCTSRLALSVFILCRNAVLLSRSHSADTGSGSSSSSRTTSRGSSCCASRVPWV